MIFKFLNKNKEKSDSNTESINIACLLIHAAKIDQNYTSEERAEQSKIKEWSSFTSSGTKIYARSRHAGAAAQMGGKVSLLLLLCLAL